MGCTADDIKSMCQTPQSGMEGRESIVLLHGSAGSAEMWESVCTELGPLYRCITPDLIGYGASKAWPLKSPFNLDAELEAMKTLLPCCGEKMHIVGYSYGGVLGLHLALSNPVLVRTLTLIEPVFFNALRYTDNQQAYAQFCAAHDALTARLSRGDIESAMKGFTDFWMGEGTWQISSPATRAHMLTHARKVTLDWQASFEAAPCRESLSGLGVRTLLIRGDRSPAPMCELVDALHLLMPGSTHSIIQGANHLLPFTHKAEMKHALLSHLLVDSERHLR